MLAAMFMRLAMGTIRPDADWVFGLAGTIPIAAASYRWIELPLLRLKRNRYTFVGSRPD
jgi:peptidoglycan/LPS O-acetylase OafA/YrhL